MPLGFIWNCLHAYILSILLLKSSQLFFVIFIRVFIFSQRLKTKNFFICLPPQTIPKMLWNKNQNLFCLCDINLYLRAAWNQVLSSWFRRYFECTLVLDSKNWLFILCHFGSMKKESILMKKINWLFIKVNVWNMYATSS